MYCPDICCVILVSACSSMCLDMCRVLLVYVCIFIVICVWPFLKCFVPGHLHCDICPCFSSVIYCTGISTVICSPGISTACAFPMFERLKGALTFLVLPSRLRGIGAMSEGRPTPRMHQALASQGHTQSRSRSRTPPEMLASRSRCLCLTANLGLGRHQVRPHPSMSSSVK